MPAKIPINDSTDKRAGSHCSESDGEVAEPGLDGVVVVSGRELRGETGEDDVEAGVDEAAVEKDEKALLFEEDRNGGK